MELTGPFECFIKTYFLAMTGNQQHEVKAFKNFHLSITYFQVTEFGEEKQRSQGQ